MPRRARVWSTAATGGVCTSNSEHALRVDGEEAAVNLTRHASVGVTVLPMPIQSVQSDLWCVKEMRAMFGAFNNAPR